MGWVLCKVKPGEENRSSWRLRCETWVPSIRTVGEKKPGGLASVQNLPVYPGYFFARIEKGLQDVWNFRGHSNGIDLACDNISVIHLSDYDVAALYGLSSGGDLTAPPPRKLDRIAYTVGSIVRIMHGVNKDVSGTVVADAFIGDPLVHIQTRTGGRFWTMLDFIEKL